MSDRDCYAMVRGSTLRVTSLSSRGEVPIDTAFAVTKFASKVTINEVSEGGSTEVMRSENTDETRLVLVRSDQTIRFGVDLDFIRVDPSLLSIISSVPIVRNASDEIVGFDAKTRLPISSFAMEVWSKLAGDRRCTPVVYTGGYGGGTYGEMPYGDSSGDTSAIIEQWGYTVFPWLKGGYLSGFAFDKGLVSFNLRGARTQRGPKWGAGPYTVATQYGGRLVTPVSRNTTWRQALVDLAPPEATCGVLVSEPDGFGWGGFGLGDGFGGEASTGAGFGEGDFGEGDEGFGDPLSA